MQEIIKTQYAELPTVKLIWFIYIGCDLSEVKGCRTEIRSQVKRRKVKEES